MQEGPKSTNIQHVDGCDPTFQLLVAFDAGSIYEPSHLRGMSHLLEHLLFLGGTKRQHFQHLKQHTVFNAETSHDNTLFHARCTLAHAGATIRALHEVTRHLAITPRMLFHETQVVFEEVISNTSRASAFPGNAFLAGLAGTPYAHGIGGSMESLLSITLDDLRSYHRERYRYPVVLFMCPRQHAPRLAAMLARCWSKVLPPSRRTVPPMHQMAAAGTPYLWHLRQSLTHQKSYVHISLKTCCATCPCLPAFQAYALLLKVELFRSLRLRLGTSWVYRVQVQHHSMKHLGLLTISFATLSAQLDTILRVALDAMVRCLQRAGTRAVLTRSTAEEFLMDRLAMLRRRARHMLYRADATGSPYQDMDFSQSAPLLAVHVLAGKHIKPGQPQRPDPACVERLLHVRKSLWKKYE